MPQVMPYTGVTYPIFSSFLCSPRMKYRQQNWKHGIPKERHPCPPGVPHLHSKLKVGNSSMLKLMKHRDKRGYAILWL